MSGRNILVDGERYLISGICYHPVPKGSDKRNFENLQQDLALMVEAGMPRFDDVLTPAQSAEIKAYVLAGARDEWELQQDGDAWLTLQTWMADKLAALMMMFIE